MPVADFIVGQMLDLVFVGHMEMVLETTESIVMGLSVGS